MPPAGCCGTGRDRFVLQMIEANWLIFIAALLIGIVVAYWLFVHSAKPPVRDRRPDVLDEGAAPAQRNQALIDDAPPASQFDIPPHIDPPAMAGTMAGAVSVEARKQIAKLGQKLAKHQFGRHASKVFSKA